jgi:hypothetical protein
MSCSWCWPAFSSWRHGVDGVVVVRRVEVGLSSDLDLLADDRELQPVDEDDAVLLYTINSLIVTLGSAGLGLLFGILPRCRFMDPDILAGGSHARSAAGAGAVPAALVCDVPSGRMIGSHTALILSHAVIRCRS